MTHVLSTGQTAMHCGVSKWPMHSVHFLGLITKTPFFSEIATFGHSGSQAEHPVHCEAIIFSGMSHRSSTTGGLKRSRRLQAAAT
jgi:hypothetical protein